jgi:hypothetical protein
MVGGCMYNQLNPELSFLWAQTIFVGLPVLCTPIEAYKELQTT